MSRDKLEALEDQIIDLKQDKDRLENRCDRLENHCAGLEKRLYGYERLESLTLELQTRMHAYDRMAAKWGGICMFAVGLGSFTVTYFEKIRDFFIASK